MLRETRVVQEQQLAERKELRQKLTLSWQLAELFEKQGNIPATEKTLLESVESVAESIHENAAWTHIGECEAQLAIRGARSAPRTAGSMNAMGPWRSRKEDWEKNLAKEPENQTAHRALAAAFALGRR